MTEWMAAMDQILADGRFRKGFRFLSDRRGVTVAPTPEEIQKSVAYFETHREALGQTRWAVLTKRGAADFGMMRMGQTLAGSLIELDFFDDPAQAERWLTS